MRIRFLATPSTRRVAHWWQDHTLLHVVQHVNQNQWQFDDDTQSIAEDG